MVLFDLDAPAGRTRARATARAVALRALSAGVRRSHAARHSQRCVRTASCSRCCARCGSAGSCGCCWPCWCWRCWSPWCGWPGATRSQQVQDRAGPRHRRCGGRPARRPAAQCAEPARARRPARSTPSNGKLQRREPCCASTANGCASNGAMPACACSAARRHALPPPRCSTTRRARRRPDRRRAGLRRGAQAGRRRPTRRATTWRSPGAAALEVMELCLPIEGGGYLVATYSLRDTLERTGGAERCARPGGRVRRGRRHAPGGRRRAAAQRHPRVHFAAADRPAGRHADAARRRLARRARPLSQPADRRWSPRSRSRWCRCWCCWRATRAAACGPSATWPTRWPFARRWRTRSSPACARATCRAASPTSTRPSARWWASAPRS